MKNFKILLILSIIMLLILSPVYGNDAFLTLDSNLTEGEPTTYQGKDIAYYIWRIGDKVYLKWTSNSQVHYFEGKVSSDTTLNNMVDVHSESQDCNVYPSPYAIDFNGTTSTTYDGFSFYVYDPGWVRFTLKVDGKLIASKSIHIGGDNSHPSGNPIIFN